MTLFAKCTCGRTNAACDLTVDGCKNKIIKKTNNDWVDVSLNGLPCDTKFYWFVPVNRFKEKFIGIIDFEDGEVYFINPKLKLKSETDAWLISQITHYKEILE